MQRISCLSVLTIAFATSACSGGSGGSASAPAPIATLPTASASPSPMPRSTATAATSTKSEIHGLIDMGSISFHNVDGGIPTNAPQTELAAVPGVFGGVVLNFTWAQLQPTPGSPIVTAPIDAALAQVRQINAQNPQSPLGVKLRIWPGPGAPDWAKALDGGPIAVQRNNQPQTVTFAHWWMPDYVAAWQSFQAQLAAAYDTEPLVHEVSITSCSSQTDEPFVPSADETSLRAAGYTDALQSSCLLHAFDDYTAWRLTRIDYTFNAFHRGDPGASPRSDTAFTQSVMVAFRAALGARGILMNHYLSAPLDPSDANYPIYGYMAALGPEIEFQTASPGQTGFDWDSTISLAVSNRASAVEVWPSVNNGFLSLPPSQLSGYAAELTANATL